VSDKEALPVSESERPAIAFHAAGHAGPGNRSIRRGAKESDQFASPELDWAMRSACVLRGRSDMVICMSMQNGQGAQMNSDFPATHEAEAERAVMGATAV
jgi:hypothetical protein